jgi:hypothetical protein
LGDLRAAGGRGGGPAERALLRSAGTEGDRVVVIENAEALPSQLHDDEYSARFDPPYLMVW